jgi:16S rRNA (guanine527-N7)-methyltransferase
MTEDEAQVWLAEQHWWDGDAGDRLRVFVTLLLEEADRQNLISASSRAAIWARHIVDSAQLLRFVPEQAHGHWVDLGSGAGLPGLVIACLRAAPITMIEARPLRVAFLQRCCDALGLAHAKVLCDKAERVTLPDPAAIISARAFAPLDRLLGSAAHLADSSTVWLLPKGRSAQKELVIARRDWQASFHVEQSLTDPESAIVILNQVSRKAPQPARVTRLGKAGRKARP